MTDQRRKRALQLYLQSSFSPDIQGLRALAVTLVFAYHLFPTSLPGGFVGVDVFFVISGYLITGLLLKDLNSSGRIALLDFYGRRVKRLLPAASAVLVAVAFLHPLLPTARWEGLSQQIAASALYYQNWLLGLQSVDYLTADADPGPLQHFWSLAVEEQYYIV
jgi:peptidoglycan/LPS O-acetylase OafA/YrhL